MRTGTVKFQWVKGYGSLQTKKQEEHFLFTLQESTQKNYAEGDRVSYEEGRKEEKLLRK
jgi:cold shock CspA family protein